MIFNSFFEEYNINYYIEDLEHLNEDELLSIFLEIIEHVKYVILLSLLAFLILFFWYWSITIGLQKKIPVDIRINLTRFKILFFIPVLYFGLFFGGIFYFFEKLPEIIDLIKTDNSVILEDYFFSFIKFIPFFLLFHFFTIFCSLHTIYFTAKTIKLAMLKKEVKFGEFIGYFLLVWFNLIGLWVLQPEINKMVDET